MNSSNFVRLFFYALLIGAPRGSKLSRKNSALLSNAYVLKDYFFEYLSRLGVLVVIFYLITESIGYVTFSYFKLVYVAFILIFFGSLHTLAYFLHKEVFNVKYKTLYMVVQTVVYTSLSGIFPAIAGFMYREINQEDPFKDELLVSLYLGTFVVTATVSVVYRLIRLRTRKKLQSRNSPPFQ